MKWTVITMHCRLCKLLSHNDDTRKIHRKSGAMEFQLNANLPFCYFIDFYSKEGDLILDCFVVVAPTCLLELASRKVVGYDLTLQNLEKVKSVALNILILTEDMVLTTATVVSYGRRRSGEYLTLLRQSLHIWQVQNDIQTTTV